MVRLAPRRKRTPTVIQMEAVECGAAALAMVLAYYKSIVPLEQLREECGVSRDGSKALNLVKAARKRGMEAKGYRYDIGDLGKATLPAIIFWNFNHFVVLEGYQRNGRTFYINDPGSGRRKVSFEEFNESYTGIVLTFQPGPEFKTGGQKSSLGGFLLSRLRGCELAFLFSLLCALFLVIPGLVIPTFTRIFVDDYLVGSEKAWLRPLLVGMSLVLLLQLSLTWLQQGCLLRFREKLALIGSGRFFTHILRLPMSYFSQRYAGEIGSRLSLNDQVAGVVGGQLAKLGLDGVLVLFFGGLMWLYDATLALIVIGVALVNALIVKAVSRARSDRNQIATQAYGKMFGTAINGLQMMETLKACGREDEFFGRWSGYQARYLTQQQQLNAFSQLVMMPPAVLNGLCSVVIMGLGAFRIMDGMMTLGTFIAFQALAGQFNGPLQSLLSFHSNYALLTANITRINDVLRAPQDPIYAPERKEAAAFDRVLRLTGQLELKEITFGYSPLDPPLVECFSLTLTPGKRVALVGGSGSGKSTIAKLVAGLYRPWSGEVLFDGCPIDAIPRPLFSASVAMVDQEIVLFSGTVRDNLTFWDASIPERAIHQACMDAEISQTLLTRPGGYRSELDEGGGNLSGGQRQRLEIARALVNSPSLLILDEATSALDAATEAAIVANLRRRGCACLIVAHRLSTIRDADEIIVMEGGKIVERGGFAELYGQEGAFYRLMQQ